MPRSLSHIPRVILENSDKLQLAKKRPIKTFRIWKILKGDLVRVMEGKSAGEIGKVTSVDRKKNTLLIDQVNLVKKHVKSTETAKGGIFTLSAPVHYSNVALIDPSDGKPTKIKWKRIDGKKVRVSKRTGEIIPKPDVWRKPYPSTGPRDTSVADTLAVTYQTPFYSAEIYKLQAEIINKNKKSQENTTHQAKE